MQQCYNFALKHVNFYFLDQQQTNKDKYIFIYKELFILRESEKLGNCCFNRR